METNRLRQFCLILETGSLSKAAEMLGVSHGGLSKSMAVLQDELGFALFQPQGRGLMATDEGRRIYKQAQELLERVDILKNPHRPAQEETYRLGLLEVFGSSVFAEPIFKEKKEANFEILELSPGQIESSLLQNRIDLGFTYLPVTMEGIEHLKVAKFSFGIYARKNAFQNTKVADIPFVAPASAAPSNPLGIKERDVWPEGLFPRKKRFQVNLLSTALNLAQHGLCAIYIPDFVASHHNQAASSTCQLEALALPSHFKRQEYHAYLVKRATSGESAMMKKLSAEMRKLCRE